MSEIFAIGLDSMQQDMRRLDQVAMNLANVATPGYKRQGTVSHPFAAVVNHMQQAGTEAPPLAAFTDARAGALQVTGRKLDLALEGDGYFEVMTAHGPAYTRQGSLQLDAGGRLVTALGQPVMGSGGEIVAAGADLAIDAEGYVFAGQAAGDPAQAIARLRIVKFADPHLLQPAGNGLFLPAAAAMPVDGQVRLRQGFLEKSNVSTQQEMVDLMQAVRHFESVQKAVQGYDEMLGIAVRKLGEA